MTKKIDDRELDKVVGGRARLDVTMRDDLLPNRNRESKDQTADSGAVGSSHADEGTEQSYGDQSADQGITEG